MTIKQVHLWAFLQGIGYFPGAWRHPDATPHAVFDGKFYQELAKKIEGACFDAIVFGDQLQARDIAGKTPPHLAAPTLDPFTLLSIMGSVTEHVGLVATVSTTYHEPYALATAFATLDRLSGGRSGWNIVTTAHPCAAWNFSETELMDKSLRYARAEEFVEVSQKLWDSGAEGAGPIDHQGKWFSVQGRLPVPRPIQGNPVLVQAGASEDGRELAARTAEAIFCPAPTFDSAKSYRDDIRSRMVKHGRDPDSVAIMPGLSFVLAPSEAEAVEQHEFLLQLANDPINIDYLSESLGFDLSIFPPDGPVPLDKVLEGCEFPQADARRLLEPGMAQGLSILEIAQRFAHKPRGHQTFRGTPAQLADHMEHWLEAGACDGFTLQPAYLPGELDLFIKDVVPILQHRGILRTRYEGKTLRSHLGLQPR